MAMEENTLLNTGFSRFLSIIMPPKRTPFASLQNGAGVVKRRQTTAAKSDPMSSGLVKPRQLVPRVKVLKPSDKELVEQLPIPLESDYFKVLWQSMLPVPYCQVYQLGRTVHHLTCSVFFLKIPYSIQL